jgi:histidinol-phosphate/aromatic aminotransferase/cobyric acid decarboxylase-like protein
LPRPDQGITRRLFGRLAVTLPLTTEAALAQLSALGPVPADAVRINANENPLGPCSEAAEAIYSAVRDGGRYRFEEGSLMARTLAEVEGVPPRCVRAYAGSSDPLHRAVLAFCSPSKSFVVADPGYEAGSHAASFMGARVHRIPLTPDYRHDVKAMAAADPQAGLIYICNPNNPTGTLTPKEDIDWLLANKPPSSVVLLDEAYIHLSHSATPLTHLVAQDKDLIVLRTFSKLYGMAGLRAGAAIARPDLIGKLDGFGTGMLPVAGMVGATASLRARNVVPERRKFVRDIREDVFTWLDKHNHPFIPSESNKFMVDVKRPGQEVVRAMAARNVFIGRVWPCWPTHVRVSVGTKEEMERFKAAFAAVLAA